MNRTELVVRLKYEHTDDIGADEVADCGAWASCVWSSCSFRHGPLRGTMQGRLWMPSPVLCIVNDSGGE